MVGAAAKTDHGLSALKISSPGTGLRVPHSGTANDGALATDGRRTSTLIKRAEEVVGLPEEVRLRERHRTKFLLTSRYFKPSLPSQFDTNIIITTV